MNTNVCRVCLSLGLAADVDYYVSLARRVDGRRGNMVNSHEAQIYEGITHGQVVP